MVLNTLALHTQNNGQSHYQSLWQKWKQRWTRGVVWVGVVSSSRGEGGYGWKECSVWAGKGRDDRHGWVLSPCVPSEKCPQTDNKCHLWVDRIIGFEHKWAKKEANKFHLNWLGLNCVHLLIIESINLIQTMQNCLQSRIFGHNTCGQVQSGQIYDWFLSGIFHSIVLFLNLRWLVTFLWIHWNCLCSTKTLGRSQPKSETKSTNSPTKWWYCHRKKIQKRLSVDARGGTYFLVMSLFMLQSMFQSDATTSWSRHQKCKKRRGFLLFCNGGGFLSVKDAFSETGYPAFYRWEQSLKEMK